MGGRGGRPAWTAGTSPSSSLAGGLAAWGAVGGGIAGLLVRCFSCCCLLAFFSSSWSGVDEGEEEDDDDDDDDDDNDGHTKDDDDDDDDDDDLSHTKDDDDDSRTKDGGGGDDDDTGDVLHDEGFSPTQEVGKKGGVSVLRLSVSCLTKTTSIASVHNPAIISSYRPTPVWLISACI